MRWLALLPLLSLPALAEDHDGPDRIRAALNAEDWAAALALTGQALEDEPSAGLLRRLEAEAHRGTARDLQRSQGYGAALDYLETRLNHPVLAWSYARTCLWGGEELRGIEHLRASGLPPGDTIPGELELLSQLRRYDEVVSRASLLESDYPAWAGDWIQWAGGEAARRARLERRARRAAWVAAVGGLAFLAGALALFRLTRRPAPAPC